MAAVTALVLFLLYAAVGFGLRLLVQYRRTGDTGFRGVSGKVGSAEWWAGVLFVLATVAIALGPVTALAGLEPLPVLVVPALQVTGAVLTLAGVVVTFVVQQQMGASWRVGVDEAERTGLVTTGTFRWVRNPIFTVMAGTVTGLTLLVPTAVALVGLALLVLAIELQVRVVEEPYLRAAHGATYAAYAARTGRFVPGVGRLGQPYRGTG